jgi:Mg2+ and Co2+ transporter CorA
MNGIRERHKKTEAVIEKFKGLKERNIARQEEIVALRDGVSIAQQALPHLSRLLGRLLTHPSGMKLFNASTVLEARTTVLQGRNIQLLTYISMLFLPASFVTSLFGMEAVLPPSMEIKAFALIFGLVCGLTYITILMMGFGGADWIIKKARRRQPKAKRNRKSQQTRKPKRQMWKIGRVRKLKRTVDAENGG